MADPTMTDLGALASSWDAHADQHDGGYTDGLRQCAAELRDALRQRPQLPPELQRMSATERRGWLATEALYDAALAQHDDPRTPCPWRELSGEAQAAAIAALLPVFAAVGSLAHNPAARANQKTP